MPQVCQKHVNNLLPPNIHGNFIIKIIYLLRCNSSEETYAHSGWGQSVLIKGLQDNSLTPEYIAGGINQKYSVKAKEKAQNNT